MLGSRCWTRYRDDLIIYLLLSLVWLCGDELIERSRQETAPATLKRVFGNCSTIPNGSNLVKRSTTTAWSTVFSRETTIGSPTIEPAVYIPSRNFALGIAGILVPDSPTDSSIAGFRDAVEKSTMSSENALSAMLHNAGEDVNKFRRQH